MHKQRVHLLLAAAIRASIAGLALVALAPVGHAEAQVTRVFLSPVAATISLGETVQVSIRIENVVNLRSVELRLEYDQSVLDVVDADPESPGTQIAPSALLRDGALGNNIVHTGIGEIAFAQTALNAPVSGSGTVAVITFRGVAAGTSSVRFANAALFDADGNVIAATVEDSEITVLGAGTPTSSPSPTTTAFPEATASPEVPVEPTETPPPAEPSATPFRDRTPATIATTRPGARDLRSVQLWADRAAGVISGAALFAPGARSARAGPLLPFGVVDVGEEHPVRGQTYLHFPLERLPAGTDILQATLYVFVDGASRTGPARSGLYRVLEDWSEIGPDPATWPSVLPAPIALAELEIGAVTATLPAPAQSPAPTPPLGETPAPEAEVTPTAPLSPLPTATGSPLRASTQPVTLSQIAGTWVSWDVTALARAWWNGQAPNHGLAVGPAPDAAADAQSAGNVLLARAFAEDLPEVRPYLVLEIEILPVTPTPTIGLLLPAAGEARGAAIIGVLLVGVALVLIGVAVRRGQRAARAPRGRPSA